jgi:uncharacterized protein YjbI with pentapeptide repeats
MKHLAQITFLSATMCLAHAQPSPTLTHRVESNGDLSLTWPVHVITTTSTNLSASYQVEIASELGAWTPFGSMIRGASFPARTATTRLTDLLARPNSFFRVRAVLDFSGGNFGGKTMQDAALTDSLFVGANFFGASLDGTSFDNANLTAGDFRFATMNEVTATNADLTLARLSDADLTSSDLRGAKLILADLSGANLNFVDLTGADLRGAIMQDMDSAFTRFHETTIDPTTVFDRRTLAIWLIVTGKASGRTFVNVDLSFADLSGGDLSRASLVGLDLSGADFTDADLRGANLTGAILRLHDLRGTQMDQTTLIAAKWRTIWDIINNPRADRSLPGADLSLGFFVDSTFERANVSSANFGLGVMGNPNFEGANAVSARFNSVEFHGANFKNADLRNANFSNAILEDVNFLGANMTNAVLFGATFRRTTMPDGSIRP